MSRRHIYEPARDVDRKILSFLMPCNDNQLIKYGSDSYFCYASKHLKRDTLASRIEKVEAWVKRNGGTFKLLSRIENKGNWLREVQGDNYGAFVQIRFPGNAKRNMKEIMSMLYDPADTVYV